MRNTTISVIIPHYSKSDTDLLERAVKSIPDSKELEVLVVDNSPIRISEKVFYYRSNVEILFSDNTRGAGHARNIGIQHAKGKWMIFLDADDFFVDGAFDLLKEYINSDNDLVFFNMTSVYSDTLEPATRHESYERKVHNYFIDRDEYPLRCHWPSPCAKLVSTDFVKINNILFDEVPASNDVMFALKVGLAADRIAVDKNYLYCATVEKGSLTNTVSLKNIESRFDVNIRKNNMLKEHGYRRSSSVMAFIVHSLKYGPIPFIKLFWRALITGNLFVGYQNWINTVMKKTPDRNKKYIIKE